MCDIWRRGAATIAAMSDIEIRTILDEELPAWSDSMARTFFVAGASGDAMASFRRSRMLPGDEARLMGAFDESRVVGTFRSFSTELTVPGGRTETVAGVTNVGVQATHRRRGILRSMMARDLRADVDRGECAAILIASEYPIYGRYGFGPATEHATWTFDKAGSVFATPLDPAVAEVEAISPVEARAILPDIYERYRCRQPGEISRRSKRWDVDLGLEPLPGETTKPGWLVLHRDLEGEPDGFMRYRVEDHYEERVPAATLTVDEMIATSPAAEAALWRYALDVDLVSTVKAVDRRVTEPVVWRLADARAARLAVRADFLWLRPLDVTALLESRAYVTPGSLVLEVVDPDGFAGGRFELDVSADGARCRATTRSPQVRLPAATLGSLYLGGVPLALLASAGQADLLDASVLPVADSLFHWPVAPFCSTWF